MSIAVACPHCDAMLSVRDDMAGRRGKCPKCGQPIDVPAGRRFQANTPAEAARAALAALEPTPDALAPSAPAASKSPVPAASAPVASDDTLPARSLDTVAAAAKHPSPAKTTPAVAINTEEVAASVGEAFSGLKTGRAPSASLAALVSRLVQAFHYLLPFLFGGALAYHYLMHQSWADNAPDTPGPLIYWLLLGLALLLTLMSALSHIAPRRPRSLPAVPLEHSKAPLLFDLLSEITRRLDAPAPKCAAVWDATLSYDRGELRLGASALGNLTIAEVIGIVARELAVQRSSGRRVARAEYTRLRRLLGEREPGEKRSIVGHLLSGLGALGRPIVWPLMVIVRTVAEGELRKAELEADAIECELVGSRGFLSAIQRLRLVNYAVELATADLPFQFVNRSLSANRVATVQENLQTLPHEVQQSILETAVDDPHADYQPTLSERVAAAQKLALPGVLKCPAPARVLIADFESLSRDVTWLDCTQRFGATVKRRDLVT